MTYEFGNVVSDEIFINISHVLNCLDWQVHTKICVKINHCSGSYLQTKRISSSAAHVISIELKNNKLKLD